MNKFNLYLEIPATSYMKHLRHLTLWTKDIVLHDIPPVITFRVDHPRLTKTHEIQQLYKMEFTS